MSPLLDTYVENVSDDLSAESVEGGDGSYAVSVATPTNPVEARQQTAKRWNALQLIECLTLLEESPGRRPRLPRTSFALWHGGTQHGVILNEYVVRVRGGLVARVAARGGFFRCL